MYDVVVAGARCGGASTAMLLARAGYRVLLLDRAELPSDTLSTLYLHQPGLVRLARWGVLAALRASGAPPIGRTTYQVADVRLSGPMPPLDGISETYAPRRHVLDWLLAQAATAAGSELRTRCAVVGLCSDGDRVTGARIRLPGGREVTERAELVIGADGMRSRVARLAGAGEYGAHQRLTCAYYAFWADVPADFEQYQQPGRWIGAMPTHDGLTLVAAYFPQREFVLVRRDPEAAYAEAVRSTAPRLYERMTAGRREGRMLGTGDQRNFLRPAAGPGWALVGDAGHHKDSITARGMTDAFGQAELLARCLTGERGERLEPGRLGAGLRRFAERRDDLVRAGYRSTLAVAQLDVQPERLRMLRAVQGSAELTERYFAAAAGILDPHEVFTPELVELLRSPPGGLAASGGSGGVVWRSAPAALEL